MAHILAHAEWHLHLKTNDIYWHHCQSSVLWHARTHAHTSRQWKHRQDTDSEMTCNSCT